jgi:hypothetical protein
MKKNVVFLMNVDPQVIDKEWSRFHSSRSKPYEFSIKSWKKWCDKNDVECFVMTDLIHPHDEMKLTWQRYYIFELLKANDIDYDQVCYVDADTIVHPDCPNFFEMTDYKLCAAQFDGSWDWVLRSIENYSKYAFGGYEMPWYKYFDSGFWIVNKKHEKLFSDMLSFYWYNAELLLGIEQQFKVGTDQTPFNIWIHKNNTDLKLLPYDYNMIDLPRREILDEDMTFTKCGWIYQYNCIPNNSNNEATYYWMKKTYEYFNGDK